MVKLTKQNYVERDISWMLFNHRILEEAQREDVPVLERLSFLGIYSNNLDEFFRVRMANLGRVAALAEGHPTKEVRTEAEKAAKQLKEINRLNAKYVREYAQAVTAVRASLEDSNIHMLRDDELNEAQKHNFSLWLPRLQRLRISLCLLSDWQMELSMNWQRGCSVTLSFV